MVKDVVRGFLTEQEQAKVKELTNTLEHISTQKALLKVENKSYKHALYKKRKRKESITKVLSKRYELKTAMGLVSIHLPRFRLL